MTRMHAGLSPGILVVRLIRQTGKDINLSRQLSPRPIHTLSVPKLRRRRQLCRAARHVREGIGAPCAGPNAHRAHATHRSIRRAVTRKSILYTERKHLS